MNQTHYGGLARSIVLVTGASRGIGRAIARGFGQQGSHVLVNCRSDEAAKETIAEIEAEGGTAEPAIADVGDPEAARALMADVVERHGRLDVLVNNAGISPMVPLIEMGQSAWEETQRVNHWALFHVGQPAAQQMVAQGGGSIVVIGSPAAVDIYDTQSAYSASKAGLHMLAMGMAWEWGRFGVRTNVVQPGWIETSLNRKYLSDTDVRDRLTKQIPQRRIGSPEEVTPAVLWLCSADASYVNGATIQVDGGHIAGRPAIVSKRLEWARQ